MIKSYIWGVSFVAKYITRKMYWEDRLKKIYIETSKWAKQYFLAELQTKIRSMKWCRPSVRLSVSPSCV